MPLLILLNFNAYISLKLFIKLLKSSLFNESSNDINNPGASVKVGIVSLVYSSVILSGFLNISISVSKAFLYSLKYSLSSFNNCL